MVVSPVDYENLYKFVIGRFSRLDTRQIDMLHWCFEEDWETLMEPYVEIGEILGAANVFAGASKVCFYFDEFPDYILKIPFQGTYEWDWELNEHNFYEGFNPDDAEIGFFERAYVDGPESTWDDEGCRDYCAVENEVYYHAKDYGVEEFFAETSFLCRNRDLDIYVAEYVPHPYVTSEASKTLTKEASSIGEDLYSHSTTKLSDTAWGCLFQQSSYDKVIKLLEFLNDFNIFDCHSGNIRFRDNGELVLIDYSDYKE